MPSFRRRAPLVYAACTLRTLPQMASRGGVELVWLSSQREAHTMAALEEVRTSHVLSIDGKFRMVPREEVPMWEAIEFTLLRVDGAELQKLQGKWTRALDAVDYARLVESAAPYYDKVRLTTLKNEVGEMAG